MHYFSAKYYFDPKQNLVAQAGFQLLTGDLMEMTGKAWQTNNEELRVAHFNLNRYEAEPYRRWANGFCCLAFVLIGATYSIRRRVADFWTCFATVFFPVVVAYYPIFQFGVNQASVAPLQCLDCIFFVWAMASQRLIRK